MLSSVLTGLCALYNIRGENHKARAHAEQLVRLAEHAQDPALLMGGHTTLAIALYYLGEVSPARAHFEQSLALHDPQQPSPTSICCLSQLAFVLWELGCPGHALDRVHDALAEARQVALPFWMGYALHFSTGLHMRRREERATQEQAEAAIALAREHGFPFWVGWANLFRGWALAVQGHGEAGIRQIQEGLDILRATGSRVGWTTALALLAEAYGSVGQIERGLSVLAEALEVLQETGGCFYEAELYRRKGQLTLQAQLSGLRARVAAGAEECFRRAIAIARRQSTKTWELRAVMSLSWLWQQQGKKDEARQMLAEIYGWFTEGFDTKDLQEAKALLEELT